MNEYGEREYPHWLVDVAVQVDELVATPAVMGRFHRMLRTWKVEHKAKGPNSPVDKRGSVWQDFELVLLPPRRLTIAGKYAVLAAIRGRICKKVRPIDPWGTSRRQRSFQKYASGFSFQVILDQVDEISDSDRPRIERTFKEVEADLTALTEDGSPAPSQTHSQSSTAPIDTALQTDTPRNLTSDTSGGNGPNRFPVTADEAIRTNGGNPWATQKQLEILTGRSGDAIRARINRDLKKKNGRLDETLDRKEVAYRRSGEPKYTYSIQAVWPLVQPDRSRPHTDRSVDRSK